MDKPGSAQHDSGQRRVRLPKSLHAKRANEAKKEAVSLNTLRISLIAEGLGKKFTQEGSTYR